MCLSCHNLTDHGQISRPITVSLKLTQEQIAAMIGSTQQTVSETLRKLKEDNLIEISGKNIILLDPRKIFDLVLQ
jgi:CRP/FNR family transcriptional regulator